MIVSRFWLRMTELWTDKWTSKVGEMPNFESQWAYTLAGLTDEQIARGLMAEKYSKKGWPSEIPEFYNNAISISDEVVTAITKTCLYWSSNEYLKANGLVKTKEAYYVICNCNYSKLKSLSFEKAKQMVDETLEYMSIAINRGYVLPDVPNEDVKKIGFQRNATGIDFKAIMQEVANAPAEQMSYSDLRKLWSPEVPV